MLKTDPEVLTTTEHPARYVAFENPGKLVEFTGDRELLGGHEYIVYYEPMVNTRDPRLTDGIYAEITLYAGHAGFCPRLLLAGAATRPDGAREQFNRSRFAGPNLSVARQALLSFVSEARAFCSPPTVTTL